MKKVVFIVGPTAVGKTNLGLKIAKHFKGSIISADSVQVYKGLDIISGKDIDTSKDLQKIPSIRTHYFSYNKVPIFLIDILKPTESFSVARFQDLGASVIKFLHSKGQVPIIVGGTGFYVKSLTEGIETVNIKPDLRLRSKLESLSLGKLQGMLILLDRKKFGSMNESDSKNKRRLVRAIEIARSDKWLMANGRETGLKDFEFLQIGLELPRGELKKKIDKRVDKRLKTGGLREVEDLFKNYKNLTQQVKDANGYKQLFEYLLGKLSLEEAVERWKIAEYKHAKNQMTWFKKDSRILWLEATREDLFEAVKWEIDIFLSA